MRELITPIIILAVACFAFLMQGFAFKQQQEKLIESSFAHQAQAMAQGLAYQLEWQKPFTADENRLVENTLAYEDVVAVWVLDEQGELLARAGLSELDLTPFYSINHPEVFITRQDPLWLVSVPIHNSDLNLSVQPETLGKPNENKGTIIIGLSGLEFAGQIEASQNQFMRTAGVISFAALVIMLVWFGFMLRRRNTEPSESTQIIEHPQNPSLEKNRQSVQWALQQQQKALSAARAEAQEANQLRTQFLANMSHEIRTPLNAIIGFTNLLLKSELNSRQRDYLNTVRKSSSSLLQILNDILDFSKIEAGKLELEQVAMDLRDVVDDVLAVMAPAADEKHIELVSIIYPNVPCHLMGDPLRLKQVLTNLVSNGIKFTDHGSISVRVSLEYNAKRKAKLKFSVIDSGIGISQEQQKRLFQAFTQADASTTRRYGGTGLGLTITKNMVEQMGGSIGVDSKPGKGAHFWFSLEIPLAEEIPRNELQDMPGSVIVYDKHPLARAGLTQQLQQLQLNVTAAHSLEMLLNQVGQAQLANNDFDAAIISLGFDIRNVDTIASQFNILNAELKCPVILLHNSMQSENVYDVISALATVTLTKPARHRELQDTLIDVLSIRRSAGLSHQGRGKSLTGSVAEEEAQWCFSKQPKILAIDDNDDNLRLICMLLESIDIDVISASSGIKALEVLKDQAVDLVLTDIHMPEMDGIELTRYLRRSSNINRDVPVIAVTAHMVDQEEKAFMAAGMDGVLLKPATVEQLIKAVTDHTDIEWIPATPDKTKIQAVEEVETNIEDVQQAVVTEKLEDAVTPEAVQPSADSVTTSVTTTSEDSKIVDISLGIQRAAGKVDLAKDLFERLIASLDNDRGEIERAWSEKDYQSLLEHVHRLHGATRYCGVPDLQMATQEVETLIKKEAFNALPNAMMDLFNTINDLQDWSANNVWGQVSQ